jgi:hypothetical protein
MSEELMLRVFADHVLGAIHLDTGLIELLQQPIYGYFEYLSELSDGYICHTCS